MKRIEELGVSPYPWEIEYSDFGHVFIINIHDALGNDVVITDYGCYPPKKEDAMLIKAAPKLYEELYNDCLALRTIVNKLREGGWVLNLSGTLEKMADRMEAVLAGAAGEEMSDGREG